jgi:hypothetical protein
MDNETLLCTCFRARAELKCGKRLIEENLAKLKNLEKIAGNSKLRYKIIKIDNRRDEESVLELSEEYVSLLFYCRKPSNAIYSSNLVIFLSLMPFLKDFYTIEFADLYSYVIEAISHGWQNTVKDESRIIESLKERIEALSDSNCRLSHQLTRLSNLKTFTEAELSVYKQFSKRVIESSREGGKCRNSGEGRSALTEMGIDAQEIKLVECHLNL